MNHLYFNNNISIIKTHRDENNSNNRILENSSNNSFILNNRELNKTNSSI